ncbi:MAG: RraA family protein [Acidobacteriota bacterium]|nr:RraA family protein [Acidobacteriota bacterium]
METHSYSRDDLSKIQHFDTCTVSNAIERFKVRLRNEGFVSGGLQCLFPDLPSVVGHAVPGRIRAAAPPMMGGLYYDRTDWWDYIVKIPAPRIIVMQDVDNYPGAGAFVGEIHANICRALDCIAYVTNGSVRDLHAVGQLGFQLFAANVSVSHAYAHIVEFGEPVEIGGLKIRPGDLLQGDRHGIQSIPESIVREIPRMVAELKAEEHRLIALCQSPEFTLEKLAVMIGEMTKGVSNHDVNPK